MEPEAKKQALRQITYGLYVLSAASDDVVGAGTVNWLSQASFEPPLVMVAAKADSGVYQAIEQAGTFAVNILSDEQKDLAQDFFRPTSVEGDQINGHAFKPGSTGAPVLDSAYAFVECELKDKLAIGDHTVLVGQVINAEHRHEGKPLEMWGTGWFYGG